MADTQTLITRSLEESIAFLRERLGTHWVVGAPLGLGKPNHLINALYHEACSDPEIRLDLFTALSLNPPKPAKGLKQRFLEPFVERQFGGYPRLQYLQDLDRGCVPANISISEFYFRSGTRLKDSHAQRHYVSSNYTHVARDMKAKGVNVLVQMVASDPQRPGFYSLGSNPDITLDLKRLIARGELLLLAQVNDQLPYMDGAAELPAGEFDLVLEQHPQRLFAVPRMPVSRQDYLVGLHASQLIRDGGTLQLGIGSLGDAVSYFSVMREQDNAKYLDLLKAAEVEERCSSELRESWGGNQPFERGLYAASEMFMEGFLHLYHAGVLKRKVYDHPGLQNVLNLDLINESLPANSLEILWQHGVLPDTLDNNSLAWLQRFGILQDKIELDQGHIVVAGQSRVDNRCSDPAIRDFLSQHALGTHLQNGCLMHAAFFLGSQWMYDTLNAMPSSERSLFQMTAVSRINQLYGGEALDRAQRLEGRFINTAMKMTLLGAAVSDQLAEGKVVSGVGGQYNFVAMAHALERGRSVLMLRSHRGAGRKAQSNIVWQYPHTTIPRHLRDIVVTEYGVADLRSANDENVIQRMICIADSRWQEELRSTAIEAGKLDPAWEIPEHARFNSPKWVTACLEPAYKAGWVSDYPFGSDFTLEEQQLARALAFLAANTSTRLQTLGLILRAIQPLGLGKTREKKLQQAEFGACMTRMGLNNPRTWREKLDLWLLTLALKSTGL